MKNKYIIITLLSVTLLISCAGNQELVSQKQAEIDSLMTLTSDLRQQLKSMDAMEAELDRLRRTKTQQDDELKQALNKLSEIKDVKVEDNRTLITNDLLFQSGSFKITPNGRKILDNIWSVLDDYPDREILIVGHTDNMPILASFRETYRSNWDLSTWRALAVLHYLKGLPKANPDRLAVAGYGPNQPIADNKTEAGRAKNRRVEIILGEKLN